MATRHRDHLYARWTSHPYDDDNPTSQENDMPSTKTIVRTRERELRTARKEFEHWQKRARQQTVIDILLFAVLAWGIALCNLDGPAWLGLAIPAGLTWLTHFCYIVGWSGDTKGTLVRSVEGVIAAEERHEKAVQEHLDRVEEANEEFEMLKLRGKSPDEARVIMAKQDRYRGVL